MSTFAHPPSQSHQHPQLSNPQQLPHQTHHHYTDITQNTRTRNAAALLAATGKHQQQLQQQQNQQQQNEQNHQMAGMLLTDEQGSVHNQTAFTFGPPGMTLTNGPSLTEFGEDAHTPRTHAHTQMMLGQSGTENDNETATMNTGAELTDSDTIDRDMKAARKRARTMKRSDPSIDPHSMDLAQPLPEKARLRTVEVFYWFVHFVVPKMGQRISFIDTFIYKEASTSSSQQISRNALSAYYYGCSPQLVDGAFQITVPHCRKGGECQQRRDAGEMCEHVARTQANLNKAKQVILPPGAKLSNETQEQEDMAIQKLERFYQEARRFLNSEQATTADQGQHIVQLRRIFMAQQLECSVDEFPVKPLESTPVVFGRPRKSTGEANTRRRKKVETPRPANNSQIVLSEEAINDMQHQPKSSTSHMSSGNVGLLDMMHKTAALLQQHTHLWNSLSELAFRSCDELRMIGKSDIADVLSSNLTSLQQHLHGVTPISQ